MGGGEEKETDGGRVPTTDSGFCLRTLPVPAHTPPTVYGRGFPMRPGEHMFSTMQKR